MTTVIITQFDPILDVLSPTDDRWNAVLSRVVTGFAKPFASSTAVTLDDPWEGRFDVFVSGTGLTYSGPGQLSGGTITSISLLSPDGQILATLANGEPGGLALDVAALKAAYRDPAALSALVAHWDIDFSAPGGLGLGGAGVTFEGAGGDDSLSGTEGMDELRGAAGDDTIQAGGGDDWLHGDHTGWIGDDAPTGNDVLHAGAGVDWLFGGAGNDSLYGGEGNDNLQGDSWGEAGADLIDGGAGDDRFYSEGGNDSYVGGAGRDRITLLDDLSVPLFAVNLSRGTLAGHGADRIAGIEVVLGSYESSNHMTGNGAHNGFLGGWKNDTFYGGGGDDRIWGDWGEDRIRGGTGNDLLGGDGGRDTLHGGSGQDAFYFTDAGGDRIEDFKSLDDQIWVQVGSAGITALGGIAASAFKDLTLGKADASDRYLYDRRTGELFQDADGSGPAARELLARLKAGTLLTHADIEIKPAWDRDDFMI